MNLTRGLNLCTKYQEKALFSFTGNIHIGSYRSAHVLLNLFNELRKRDKMQGLSSILSIFRNNFNKFNMGIQRHQC